MAQDKNVHLRWGEWLAEWKRRMKIDYRPSTSYTYEKACNKWLDRIWDKKELRAITKADVHELLYEKMTDDIATQHTRKSV